MKRTAFHKWFNNDFWRAFRTHAFPIKLPQTASERVKVVDRVYDSIISARYMPSIPEAETVVNKGFGVARSVPVFCIQDYCVYYFCIKELEDVLCLNRTPNTFGGWTLGGRMRKQEASEVELECELTDYGRYSFDPRAWTRAFGEFNSLLFSQLDQGHYSHVLQFDLSNFYDCVRLDILERWIREEASSSKGRVIALLFYLLNNWNRHKTGLHPQTVGLPQDALADCSRILANYYLRRYDRFAAVVCSRLEAVYFRYSDDQMILLNDLGMVDRVLLLLTRELDRYGLRVNQMKVRLWEAADLQKHRCREIQRIFAKKGDSKDQVLVRRFAKAYLGLPERRLKASWNGGVPLLNRLLWANLESLPSALFEPLLRRYLSDAYLLAADHKKLIRVRNLNQRADRPIDLARRLRRLGEATVHNAFHHEGAPYAAAVGSEDLRLFFNKRIVEIRRFMASAGRR